VITRRWGKSGFQAQLSEYPHHSQLLVMMPEYTVELSSRNTDNWKGGLGEEFWDAELCHDGSLKLFCHVNSGKTVYEYKLEKLVDDVEHPDLPLAFVCEKLCMYDKRNPLFNADLEGDRPENCMCDCCFRGTHKLANELLRYRSYES